MTSMTGYAYEEKSTEEATVSVEIKSVNSRFLDLAINLPPYLNPLESYFRAKITEKVLRGKVDVYIRVRENESDSEVIPDTNAAVAYMNAIKKIAEATGFADDVSLGLIISQPGVLNVNRKYDVEKYKAMIEPVFEAVLTRFMEDRKREGENMKVDLEKKLEKLSECAKFFTEWQPKMEQYFKEQITTKFRELLEDKADENRIMTETAAMLVKYTINEQPHCSNARRTCKKSSSWKTSGFYLPGNEPRNQHNRQQESVCRGWRHGYYCKGQPGKYSRTVEKC